MAIEHAIWKVGKKPEQLQPANTCQPCSAIFMRALL
jgi:hypothetical protein